MTVQVQINDDDDDAEQLDDGTLILGSNDVDFGDNYVIGLRFDLCLPVGATVLDASLTFVADEPDSSATSAEIWAEPVGDAPSFTTQDIVTRARTTNSVIWPSISSWVEGDVETSPDLTAVLAEVVGASAWSGCGNVVFLIQGSGDREAVAHDKRPNDSALLTFTYQP